MKMTKFVVTYIEYGDSADGRPRALGIFNTKAEAEMEIDKDMKTYGESLETPFFGDWCVWASKEAKWEQGCAWNVNEIEL